MAVPVRAPGKIKHWRASSYLLQMLYWLTNGETLSASTGQQRMNVNTSECASIPELDVHDDQLLTISGAGDKSSCW